MNDLWRLLDKSRSSVFVQMHKIESPESNKLRQPKVRTKVPCTTSKADSGPGIRLKVPKFDSLPRSVPRSGGHNSNGYVCSSARLYARDLQSDPFYASGRVNERPFRQLPEAQKVENFHDAAPKVCAASAPFESLSSNICVNVADLLNQALRPSAYDAGEPVVSQSAITTNPATKAKAVVMLTIAIRALTATQSPTGGSGCSTSRSDTICP